MRSQRLVQSKGDIGVFCRVGASLLQINLVEGQLLGAFAGDRFESDGLLAQVLPGQRVHVVTRPYGIEYVGLQHGVFRNAFQVDAVVGQHVLVVFEVLAELGFLRVFQQRFQLVQHCFPVQLFRGAHIIVAKWHVGSLAGLNGKGHTNDIGVHITQAGGLGIKGEQRCLVEAINPGIQLCLIGHYCVCFLFAGRIGAVVDGIVRAFFIG